MESLVASASVLSYRYGVSSRSLIATVIDILTRGGFISKYFVWHFFFCSTIFLSFLISVYLGFIIRKSGNTIKQFTILLSLIYLSCFTSPAAYFGFPNFGRSEIFAFMFMLLLIAVINKPGIRWIIPVLALFTMGAHLILVFFYLPFVFIMLLYTILLNEKKDKNDIALFTVSLAAVMLAFIVYLLFHEKTFVFSNAHDFYEYLKIKSDLDFSERGIYMTLFAKLSDHLDDWKERMNSGNRDGRGYYCIIINIPLLILFVIFWIKCFLRQNKKTIKFFFILPVLSLIYQAVAFLLFFDFGRWMIMILNVQFMLVFFLIYMQNTTVLSIISKMEPFLNKNEFIIFLICLLMIFIGPVHATTPSERASAIMDIIRKLVLFPFR
jgi:hypothetical protein